MGGSWSPRIRTTRPYLYWFHFAHGNLQPAIGRLMAASRAKPGADHPVQKATLQRFGGRAAYRRAMERSDPDRVPMLA